MPPSDSPEREKQPAGEHCRQIPPTPASQLSEALLASDKCGCRILHSLRVREVCREGRMMEDDSAGTMLGL